MDASGVQSGLIVNSPDTFEALTADWLDEKAKKIAAGTVQTVRNQLENHVPPTLGARPIADIKLPHVLEVLRRIQGGGAGYTATRMRAVMAQIFRFGIQTGRAESELADSW